MLCDALLPLSPVACPALLAITDEVGGGALVTLPLAISEVAWLWTALVYVAGVGIMLLLNLAFGVGRDASGSPAYGRVVLHALAWPVYAIVVGAVAFALSHNYVPNAVSKRSEAKAGTPPAPGSPPPSPGGGSLPAPASGSATGARPAAPAAVVTPAPGQQCARCGDPADAQGSARRWGKQAVCGRCAADLGIAG